MLQRGRRRRRSSGVWARNKWHQRRPSAPWHCRTANTERGVVSYSEAEDEERRWSHGERGFLYLVIVVKTVMVTGKGSDKSNVKQCSSQAAGAFPCSSPTLQNAAILCHYSNKRKRLCERRRERKMSREREKHCVGFNWLLYELANRFCCDSLISTVVMIFLSAVNTPNLNLLLLLLNSEMEWLTGRWCVYMSVFVSSDTVHLIRRVIWPC